MPKPLGQNGADVFRTGSGCEELDQKFNTAPVKESIAPKDLSSPSRLGPAEIRSVSRCFDQLASAEAALVGARTALSELSLPNGVACPFAAPRSPVAKLPLERPTIATPPCIAPRFEHPSPAWSSQSLGAAKVQNGMTAVPSKADWKTMDQAGSSAIHPVAFDQAIVGCIGAQSTEGPSPAASPALKEIAKQQAEYLSPHDIFWEPIFSSFPKLKLPMLHPECKIRLVWTIVGFVFIVYELYAIPVYLAFQVEPKGGFLAFVSMINLFFLLDIGFQFLSCYMNKKGALVSSPGTVALQYLRTWFLPDVVAGIPWEWINTSQGSVNQITRSVRFIRAARMFRLARLIRIMKLRSVLERFETRLESNHVFTFVSGVLRIILLVFAILHWGACLWYAVGTSDPDAEHCDGSPCSWVSVHQQDYPYIGENKWDHYIFSLYFSLTTMTTVGYGDITPTNFSEVSFAMVLLCVSSMVFAGLMGTLTDMIGALNSQRHELAEKKMLLSRYMHWRAVPRRLTLSIRQHLLFLWDANEGYDAYEDAIKEQLPPVLRAELCHHIYGRILTSAPFFAWMKDFPICTKFLCQKVQSIFLERGDHIFRMGQRNEQIYMLLTGEVVASRNENLFEDTLIFPEAPQSGRDGTVMKTITEPVDEGVSFDIPRNKESNLSLDMSKVVQKARKKHATEEAANGQRSPSRTPTYGTKKSGHEMFDSEVLMMAHVELRRMDVRRQAAAKKVQRIWRAKQLQHKRKRGKAPLGNEKERARQGLKISRMRSRHISAPAYFGESCLWQPLDAWSSPPLYLYTVRCESRGEIIYIPREAILECFERFSPWLQERYEVFAQTVAKKMQSQFQGSSELRDWALDFAMADVTDIGSDDAALQAAHTQALGRDGGHKARQPKDQTISRPLSYDGPAMPRQHPHYSGHALGEASAIKRMNSGHILARARSYSNNALGSPVMPPRHPY